MQAAENRPWVDRPGRRTNGGPGRVEQQAPVGTFCVVIVDKLGEHHPEVLLVDDDQVVEALIAQGPDDVLRDRIGRGARTGLSKVGIPRR